VSAKKAALKYAAKGLELIMPESMKLLAAAEQ
jgi:hypothetical protein